MALAVLIGCGGGSDGGPTSGPGDVVVADLDGDGADDIAATMAMLAGPPPHPGMVKVWLQRRDVPGSFEPSLAHAVGPDPWQLRVGDVDGDGTVDLVAMSSHASAVPQAPLVDVVAVLRGDPAQPGRFLPAAELHAGARLSDLAVADLDGDGADDIAFTSHGVAAYLGVWWSAGGLFGAPQAIAPGTAGALVAADLDGDARPDLAYVAADDAFAVQRDPATARGFQDPVRIGGGANLSCLAAVDLDRDGHVDLAVGSREATDVGAPGDLLIWRNAGEGGSALRFDPLQQLPLTVHAFTCVPADMDVDGRPDVVTTGAAVAGHLLDDVIEVFLDDPGTPGRLLNAVATVTRDTASGYHLAVGRLDADDRPDVAVPYRSGVLLLHQDPAHPGVLVRGAALR